MTEQRGDRPGPEAAGDEAEGADDLLGRWLEHHERDPERRPARAPAPEAAPEPPRPAPAAGPDDSGFEPVLLASVRRRLEQEAQADPAAERRGRLRRARRQAPAPDPLTDPLPEVEPEAESTEELLARLRAEPPAQPVVENTVEAAAPEPEPEPEAPPTRPARRETTTPVAAMPAVYDFRPLTVARTATTLLLLAGLVLTGVLGWQAWQERTAVSTGLAAIAAVATLAVWAVRTSSPVTRLQVRTGQLEVRRQGDRFVFDLAGHYTPVEVIGQPGERRWKVLFLRRGMPPFVVDRTMVDPHDFMRVLRFFRPEREF
ncbi:hypothetical protein [Nocardioides sp. SYSU D00038]|uniref:hypothetical protein n=1 Tax=Nocardioides sp. SYSU D00038 TaxID=2812554 RepID=UPI0019680AB9|nr:hypothetical protein [Nocardioides sp. SYSU D00038]